MLNADVVASKRQRFTSFKSQNSLTAYYYYLVLFIALSACNQRHCHHGGRIFFLVDATTAASSSLAESTLLLPESSSSASSTIPTTENRSSNSASFHDKFESYGPTLTLTLRDPFSTSFSSGSSDRAKPNNARNKKMVASRPSGVDSADHGITAKVAAIFHISRTPSPSSTSTVTTPSNSQFEDGYMLDDGEIFLSPPSETAVESSTTRGLFPLGGIGTGLFGGWRLSSLSECFQNVHPEVRYEIKTRDNSLMGDSFEGDIDANDMNHNKVDTRPFPMALPWLTAVSCGMAWRPFPYYKPGYPDGYGHKLLTTPHFVRCGGSVSIPRMSKYLMPWKKSSTSQNLDEYGGGAIKKVLNLGATYRDDIDCPGGTLELLLGKSSPSLPPPSSYFTRKMKKANTDMPLDEVDENESNKPSTLNNNEMPLSRFDPSRSNNHFLIRLATGMRKGKLVANDTTMTSPFSSIEYARGSFRIPSPFFLRDKWKKGVCMAPSYDFVEGKARCVFSGDVGSSGRTRAVLRLDTDDSTLTLVRALDER